MYFALTILSLSFHPFQPTNPPSPLPTSSPTTGPPTSGEYVNTIFSTDSTASSVGCASGGGNQRAFDKTTEKFYCNRDSTAEAETSGLIVYPALERLSVAKKLRVYAHNNCPNCDGEWGSFVYRISHLFCAL